MATSTGKNWHWLCQILERSLQQQKFKWHKKYLIRKCTFSYLQGMIDEAYRENSEFYRIYIEYCLITINKITKEKTTTLVKVRNSFSETIMDGKGKPWVCCSVDHNQHQKWKDIGSPCSRQSYLNRIFVIGNIYQETKNNWNLLVEMTWSVGPVLPESEP